MLSETAMLINWIFIMAITSFKYPNKILPTLTSLDENWRKYYVTTSVNFMVILNGVADIYQRSILLDLISKIRGLAHIWTAFDTKSCVWTYPKIKNNKTVHSTTTKKTAVYTCTLFSNTSHLGFKVILPINAAALKLNLSLHSPQKTRNILEWCLF